MARKKKNLVRKLTKKEAAAIKKLLPVLIEMLGDSTPIRCGDSLGVAICTGHRDIRRLDDGKLIQVGLHFLEPEDLPFDMALDDIDLLLP